MVIWTIARLKRLRTVQNLLIALLAVVDFLIIGYLVPFGMKVLVTNAKPEADACRFQSIITAFLFSCSIQFIMLVAVSRYVKVCHSQKFAKVFTVRNVMFATLGVVLVSMAFSTPLWSYEFLWTFEDPMHSCIFDRYGSDAFSITFMFLIVAVPAIVTAFSYIQIYRYVRKSRSELHKHWNNGLARRKLIYEQMVTKTQFIVFIFYMIMYFPFGITAVGANRSDFPDIFHTISIYLCYLNSCINSFLYGVFNKNMRKSYLESLPFVRKANQNRVAPTVSTITQT